MDLTVSVPEFFYLLYTNFMHLDWWKANSKWNLYLDNELSRNRGTLRKHACSNILKILPPKKEITDFFIFLLKA